MYNQLSIRFSSWFKIKFIKKMINVCIDKLFKYLNDLKKFFLSDIKSNEDLINVYAKSEDSSSPIANLTEDFCFQAK